ncbi:MAG: hypothetical protein Q4C85_08675 [Actinomyces sp.]|uniref:hypothetical protein n=1 Tax=Actinomyces sp. TaxID=29317 RepID=UPI0026DD3C96|nr:hypothetical protein [Actinomyces sp.]MDO4243812.1 hypothetical protein [Actinomyces sp.]
MTITDARGHRVPEGTDQASRQSLLDLSLSIPSVATAGSLNAANQLVRALTDAGIPPSPSSVLTVRRTDIGATAHWDGSAWAYAPDQVAGQIAWAGTAALAANAWYPVAWQTASPIRVGGVTWNGSGFVVPYKGLYRIEAFIKTTCPSASTGRLGVGVATNGSMDGRSVEGAAPSGADYVGFALSFVTELQAGNTVELRNRQDIATSVDRKVAGLSVERVAAY